MHQIRNNILTSNFIQYRICKRLYNNSVIQSTITLNRKRNQYTIRSYHYHELSYGCKGEPKDVLNYYKVDDDDSFNEDLLQLKSKENNEPWVRVEWKYSSLNPADINTVQGKYPSPFLSKNNDTAEKISNLSKSSVTSHTVGGSEAIGIVTHIHDDTNSSTLEIGDVVLPLYPGLGTWRSSILAPLHYFIRVPLSGSYAKDKLDLQTASTISVNPSTAYRLLHSLTNPPLEQNEIILQNGGASMVGFYVSQLASLQNIQCVSIVRRGSRTKEEFDLLCEYLSTTGKAALVFEEESLLENKEYYNDFKTKLKSLGKEPRLALDCVGGESASKLLLRNLSNGGTMVTYGGMSKKPITVGAGQLIFQNVHVCGYWHSRWVVNDSTVKERVKIMEYIADGLLDGSIVDVPKKIVPLSRYEDAFDYSGNDGPIREKVIFQCDG